MPRPGYKPARRHVPNAKQFVGYLRRNPGRQMCATPASTVTFGALGQLTSNSQPRNLELDAARAASLTCVPAGKNTLPQVPVVPVAVNVQSIPAGTEVTRPSPVPPRVSETLPLLALNDEVTVIVAPLLTPPASATMVEEMLLVTGLVSTGKVARVAPPATVTVGGTVAALVLSLVRTTDVPPCGAAESRVTVPVTPVPPTTVLELSVTPETAGPVAAGVTASVNDRVAEPWEAVMSAEVLAVTGLVAAVNVAVMAPSATVTLAGTVATDVSPLESVTTIPPAVAGAVNVTVPVEGEPPSTERGLRLRLESVGLFELTVSVADLEAPPALAVMTEELLPAVVPAWIAKVTLVPPPATVTLSGTVAAATLPLESATTSPPAGAGPVRVTVPVLVEPSRTSVGLRVRPEGVGLAAAPVVTVSTDDLETPPPVAVMVAELLVVTAPVVMVNVPLVAPPVTTTLGGTAATEELLLVNATVCPPEGAAEVRVTVPVDEAPPTTDVGLRLRAESVGVVEVTVQPDRRAVAAVADPSFTSTVQSAGAVKPLLSILNLPPPSLVPIATPSTVIVLLARAWPSILS